MKFVIIKSYMSIQGFLIVIMSLNLYKQNIGNFKWSKQILFSHLLILTWWSLKVNAESNLYCTNIFKNRSQNFPYSLGWIKTLLLKDVIWKDVNIYLVLLNIGLRFRPFLLDNHKGLLYLCVFVSGRSWL